MVRSGIIFDVNHNIPLESVSDPYSLNPVPAKNLNPNPDPSYFSTLSEESGSETLPLEITCPIVPGVGVHGEEVLSERVPARPGGGQQGQEDCNRECGRQRLQVAQYTLYSN